MTDLVFGKYEIQHRLAIGGMGEVFYSVQRGVPGFERPVILKSLLPELAQQEGFIDQFLDEARVAATLNHPNVVSIFEVGQWNGTYYLAMEYIRGRNLAQVVRKALEQGSMVPPVVTMRIIRDAALGLDHAHRATDGAGEPLNIVHRDISPQNIMVREDGLTKVVDFGIARASNRATRTATGALKGKLAYMAPEQVLSTVDVGPRVDQFALGIVLWELLTHRRLFKAERDIDVAKKVIEEPIAPPSTLVELPVGLDAVVMRMLERPVARRFPSLAEAAEALDAVIRNSPPSVTPAAFMRQLGTEDLVVKVKATPQSDGNFVISLKAPNSTSQAEEVAINTASIAALKLPAPLPPKRSKTPLLVVAALALVAVGGFGLSSARSKPTEPVAPPAAVPPVAAPAPAPPVVVEAPAPVAAPVPEPVVAPANGWLKLVTTPPRATLRVDGKPVGQTPSSVELTPNQPHYLLIELPGFKRVEQDVTLAPDEDKVLTIKLQPNEARSAPKPQTAPPLENAAPGYLTLETEPWTKVSVDGDALGSTPLFKRKLSAGSHRLQLVNEGANVNEARVVDIRPGETTKLKVKLR